MRIVASLALGLFAAGCGTSGVREGGESALPFGEKEAIDLYVRYMEADRRRDISLARTVLHFEDDADLEALGSDYEVLAGKPGGTIRTQSEIRLASQPDSFGAGIYVFLVPLRKEHVAEAIEIVFVAGEPRVVYAPLPISAEEAAGLAPIEARRLSLTRVIERWNGLEGERLEREVTLTLETLAALARARSYAQREALTLLPFEPTPEEVLAELDGLDFREARRRYVERLEKERERLSHPDPGE